MSWEGEPLPDLGALPMVPDCIMPPVKPKGDRPAEGRESMGEFVDEGEFDRAWPWLAGCEL
jgi:hypothetical protein